MAHGSQIVRAKENLNCLEDMYIPVVNLNNVTDKLKCQSSLRFEHF